jgi:hypothetical protein
MFIIDIWAILRLKEKISIWVPREISVGENLLMLKFGSEGKIMGSSVYSPSIFVKVSVWKALLM